METILNSEPLVKHSNQVHTTKDYCMFKSIDGNRQKNELHVKRLLRSMKERYLFNVIIVNEKYEIIDGQHRFDCIKQLGLPMYYVVCPGYGIDEVHKLNANSKNWSADDFLIGYCDLGLKDYLIFREFKKKYSFGMNECIGLLYGVHNGDSHKMFTSGRFKIKNLQEAERKADLISMVATYYHGWKRRSFVYAMSALLNRDNFIFSEFIQKLKHQPKALVDCPSVSSYIALIEEIYNYRRRDKVNLRF